MAERLQLGASRLEHLDVRVLNTFLDKTWFHLGDSRADKPRHGLVYYGRRLRADPMRFLRTTFKVLLGTTARPERTTLSEGKLYERTNFQEFLYRKGDRLPFGDASFGYIFSEHFFEHFFFDEAIALFEECRRVLKPYGVIRTVVPDADLRTYAPPEPVGFPSVKVPFDNPSKHLTRWSVYMLSEALRLAGFDPIPLRYCDRHGKYIRKDPAGMRSSYEQCPERELVFELGHVFRLDSLIVDGMRRPDSGPAS